MDVLEIATVRVTGVHAQTVRCLPIPAGIVGAQVRILYDGPMWSGLQKTVVFRGKVTRNAVSNDGLVTVPAEVVDSPGVMLSVGVYGVDADGNIAIPTLWADLGIVRNATDPSGDPTTDPSLPVWAQLRAMIGDLVANPPQITETDPTVPAWAKQKSKPTYTAQEVGADPAGTAASAVSQHNVDMAAHNDLRIALQELSDRVNAALDSDDTTMDQMSEIVAYIKSNKTLIDAITTNKVSVTDIVNDLVTNVADKPLSAAQGVALKGLIDALSTDKLDAAELTNAINTALAQAKDSGLFNGTDGSDGGYYTPSVSQPDANTMTVSFAPSQDGMPAVPEKSVTLPAGPTGATPNIKIGTVETLAAGSSATASMDGTPENPILNLGIPKGAAGQDGNTPVKGKDYFTEADKAELVNSVLSALPAAEGVNY